MPTILAEILHFLIFAYTVCWVLSVLFGFCLTVLFFSGLDVKMIENPVRSTLILCGYLFLSLLSPVTGLLAFLIVNRVIHLKPLGTLPKFT